jgi:hypothetical protein
MENCETRAKPPAPLSRSTVYETGAASIQQRLLEGLVVVLFLYSLLNIRPNETVI